jgi:hypothetical protein
VKKIFYFLYLKITMTDLTTKFFTKPYGSRIVYNDTDSSIISMPFNLPEMTQTVARGIRLLSHSSLCNDEKLEVSKTDKEK